jgi:hypothetical protein
VNLNVTSAVRFWEQHRIPYNLLLTMVFIGWVALNWPMFKGALSPSHFLQLAGLVLIANLLYSAAYATELFFVNTTNRSDRWRWVVWTIGTLFAVLVESYWVNDEMIAPLIH